MASEKLGLATLSESTSGDRSTCLKTLQCRFPSKLLLLVSTGKPERREIFMWIIKFLVKDIYHNYMSR